MNPPTTTASAQSTLEEVKELAKHQNDNACAMCCSRECTQCSVLFSFPSIASLVESQAKRNAELEAENRRIQEGLTKMKESVCGSSECDCCKETKELAEELISNSQK